MAEYFCRENSQTLLMKIEKLICFNFCACERCVTNVKFGWGLELFDRSLHSCYRYTDVWNRHRESEIHDIGSGTKLYYLWVKGYSTWGERDTIFLCWLLLHRQLSIQPTRGTRSAQSRLASPSSESRLSRSEAGTQLAAFSRIPKSSAHASGALRHSHPLVQLQSGIFILTSLNDTSSPHAREHLR